MTGLLLSFMRAVASKTHGKKFVGALVAMALLALVAGAFAYWTSSGSGTATASAGTLNAPTITAATPGAGTVALSWSAVSAPAGGTVKYYVRRNGTAPAGDCPSSSATSTATSCTDSGLSAGTYSYTVTAVWQSWTATSAAQSVTVAYGALDHFALTAATTTPTAGAGDDLTITAKDAGGITVANYSGSHNLVFGGANTIGSFQPTVTNSSGTAISFGSITAVNFTGGVSSVASGANGAMRLYKVETANVTASEGLVTTSSPPAIVVQPASASRLSLSGYPASTIAGDSHSFTVTALDGYGNTATGYLGTVKFSATNDTQAGLPSNYAFQAADGGAKNFNATFKTVAGGTKTLTATDTVTSAIAGSESGITVSAGVATTISVVSGSGQSTPINTSFGNAPTAQVVDAYANPVSGAAVTFTGPSSGASGTFGTCTSGNPQTYSCVVATGPNGQASSSSFTANGTAGGPYSVSASAPGTNSTNFSLTNVKASQAITFTSTAPSNAKVAGATYMVSAIGGGSGNAVTFTIDASAISVCSISGATVSFTAAGTCVIDANQAGSSSYNAAPQAQQSFSVAKGDQTISFGTLANKRFDQGPITVSATASSGLTVTFSSATTSVCTVSGTTVTFVTIGTCTINADQAGDSNWNAAPTVPQSFIISKGNQTISFTSTAPTDATVGGATYSVSATASSGLTPAFTIDSSASTVCSISASVVSFTGSGACVIDANQAGDGKWNAAPQVQQSFTVISPVAYTAIGPAQTWTSSGAKPVSYPAGTAVNDLVLLVLVNNRNTAGPPAPTGWTLLGDTHKGSDIDVAAYWRLSGGETSVSLNPSPGGSGASAWVVRYNRSSGYPPNPATAATTVISTSSGSGSSTLIPAIATTTAANATMISIVGEAGTSSLTFSGAQGFTRQTTLSSTGTSLGIGDRLVATSGTTPTAPTWSSSVSGDWGGLTVAFH